MILNRVSLAFLHIFWEEALSVSSLIMMLVAGVYLDALYQTEEVPCSSEFAGSLDHEWMLHFVKRFSLRELI